MSSIFKQTLVGISFFTSVFISQSYAADQTASIHNIQYKRLSSPSSIQKKYEKKGKVYLYIGLKDKEVDRILDKQFERIENFMFVSVLTTDKNENPIRDVNGKLILESDDC